MMYTVCVSLFPAILSSSVRWHVLKVSEQWSLAFLPRSLWVYKKSLILTGLLYSLMTSGSTGSQEFIKRIVAMAITWQQAEWGNPGLPFSSPDTVIWHESLTHAHTISEVHSRLICKHVHTADQMWSLITCNSVCCKLWLNASWQSLNPTRDGIEKTPLRSSFWDDVLL